MPALAQPQIGTPAEITAKTDISVTGIFDLIRKLVNWFAAFIGIVAVVMLLYAGVLFMTGTDENITKAKNVIIYGIVGVAVAAMSWGIANLVNSLLQ